MIKMHFIQLKGLINPNLCVMENVCEHTFDNLYLKYVEFSQIRSTKIIVKMTKYFNK